MMPPPLIAVAHGSRDSRSAATMRALVDEVGHLAGGLDVRVAFLDLSEPSVTDVLEQLHAEGHRDATVVPLLLGSAYHARVDLPSLVRRLGTTLPDLRVSITDVLGADSTLEALAVDRLTEAGAQVDDPELGIVLAAVGSSQASANAVVARLAARWCVRYDMAAVTAGFATAAEPDIPDAIARLRAGGARRFAIAPWFLAPGLLLDKVGLLAQQSDPNALVAEPLGAQRPVAELVLRRYEQTVLGTAAQFQHRCVPGTRRTRYRGLNSVHAGPARSLDTVRPGRFR